MTRTGTRSGAEGNRPGSGRHDFVRRPFAAPSALAVLLIVLAAAAACGGGGSREASSVGEAVAGEQSAGFELSSTAFADGGRIPARNTCDGEDRSIPLAWSGAPEDTAAFAIVLDDPDAPGGTFKHWMIFNLPATRSDMPESVDKVERVLGTAFQVRNDFGRTGYGGPCPPSGQSHTYRVFLYALDAMLDLNAGSSQSAVLDGIQEHALARAELPGVYGR